MTKSQRIVNGVTLQIGANNYSALIDSGAGISAISLNFQQNEPILKNLKLEKTIPTEIYGADHQQLKTHGDINVPFSINNIVSNFRFVVIEDLSSPIILGQMFYP